MPPHRLALLTMSIIFLAVFAVSGTAVAQGQATGTVEGTVKNAVGDGINNVNITVTINEMNYSDQTGDGGEYEIEAPVGSAEVVVTNTSNYETTTRSDILIETDDTTTEDFELERSTREINGTVRVNLPDGTIERVSDVTDDPATVKIKNHPEQDLIKSSDQLNVKTETDPEADDPSGYNLDVPTSVSGSEYDIKAVLDGYNSPDSTPGTDLLLDVNPGTITGTITEQTTGGTIEGATVTVDDADPDDFIKFDTDSDTTNASGFYEIENVPPGDRRIEVTADTFRSEKADITVDEDESTEQNITLTHEQLQIDSVVPSNAQSGETVSIEYTYTGEFETINFTVGDGQIVPTTSVDASEDEVTFEIPDRDEIDDGNYTITLATPRRTATETIRVLNPVDPEAVGVGELDEEVYRAPAGGFVEISTGGEYMLIGGDTSAGSGGGITQYLDILHVEGGSTTINTRLIGTNVSSERAYGDGVKSYAHSIGADSPPRGDFADVTFSSASTLAGFRQKVDIGGRPTPLQTGRYRILAGENGRITVDSGRPRFRKPVGRSNLVLTQPRLEAVNTYVLPPESANAEDVAGPSEDATESNTIADGERLLIEIQATGMYGAMIEDPTVDSIPPENVGQLLEKREGVSMDLSTWYYNSSKNIESDLQFENVSSSDMYILPDKTTDQWDDESVVGEDTLIGGLYIVVDTRGEAFSAPAYGDVMQFKTAYESPAGSRYLFQDVGSGTQPEPFAPAVTPDDGVGHFPYLGASDTTITVNSTIEYMEPSIQYGRTTFEGDLIVPAETGGQVLGSTTLAPGTEATIQFIDQSRPDPELVTIEEVTIEEDRTFTASADFSALDSGDQVTVEFYTAGRLPGNRVIDRRGARVVENISNIANYQITNFTSPIEVQQRSSLAAVEATITNTGELTGQQVVKFSIDGEPIRNESLRLSGNGSKTLDLSGQFVTLPVGTYEYMVRTDNDEQTGEIRVTEPTSGTTITNEESTTATTTSPLDENEVPSDDDGGSTPSGLFGFVGVSGRDVALGTAITGAAHVLGYWT